MNSEMLQILEAISNLIFLTSLFGVYLLFTNDKKSIVKEVEENKKNFIRILK